MGDAHIDATTKDIASRAVLASRNYIRVLMNDSDGDLTKPSDAALRARHDARAGASLVPTAGQPERSCGTALRGDKAAIRFIAAHLGHRGSDAKWDAKRALDALAGETRSLPDWQHWAQTHGYLKS